MKSKFHAPTKSDRAKDAKLLAEIKRQRKKGKYLPDDDDCGQEKQLDNNVQGQ